MKEDNVNGPFVASCHASPWLLPLILTVPKLNREGPLKRIIITLRNNFKMSKTTRKVNLRFLLWRRCSFYLGYLHQSHEEHQLKASQDLAHFVLSY